MYNNFDEISDTYLTKLTESINSRLTKREHIVKNDMLTLINDIILYDNYIKGLPLDIEQIIDIAFNIKRNPHSQSSNNKYTRFNILDIISIFSTLDLIYILDLN